MRKELVFCIDETISQKISFAIRDKFDYATLILNIIQSVKLSNTLKISDSFGNISFVTEKMKRVFCRIDKKIFSVSFPFSIQMQDGEILFQSRSAGLIDGVILSNALSVLNSEKLRSESCVAQLADLVMDLSYGKPELWSFLKELLFFEDSYIRFDHDPERENAALHPLNHLDVFYSNSGTFKLGLDQQIGYEDFIDILDLRTNCHFIGKARF